MSLSTSKILKALSRQHKTAFSLVLLRHTSLSITLISENLAYKCINKASAYSWTMILWKAHVAGNNKKYLGLHVKCPICLSVCLILARFEFYRQILIKVSNMKFSPKTRPVGTELTHADRRTTWRSEYELIATMRGRLNMKSLLVYASCYLMALSVTQRIQVRMTVWLLMNTELERFSKETLKAYSSYYFFVCPEEMRNIVFHRRQQTEKKKMKQVNGSQQLKRNGTERCRKYNENSQRKEQTGME